MGAAGLLLAGCGDTNAPDSTGDPSTGATASGATAGTGSGAAGNGATGNGGSGGLVFDCTEVAEPSELLAVGAGEFVMGCNAEVDAACEEDEKPMLAVSLSAFEIERTEVTQAQYTGCVLDEACEPPSCAWSCGETELAASCLTWEQAQSYCAWAGRRLPSEAQWEKAARGTDGAKFPWGDAEPDCTLANMAGCGEALLPVGSLQAGASPYGALDMAGNMVEMVADWYDADYYASAPATDPGGPASGERFTGRGGGFKSDAEWMRSSKRDWYDLTDAGASLGFRCAR